jgi:hypothetical protein
MHMLVPRLSHAIVKPTSCLISVLCISFRYCRLAKITQRNSPYVNGNSLNSALTVKELTDSYSGNLNALIYKMIFVNINTQ